MLYILTEQLSGKPLASKLHIRSTESPKYHIGGIEDVALCMKQDRFHDRPVIIDRDQLPAMCGTCRAIYMKETE